MLSCHLTKLESAVEQVRKTYPKLRPTDVALLTSSLVLMGRHALANYEGKQFSWPEDYPKLTEALLKEIEAAAQAAEPVKKASKNAPEEEPVVLTVNLVPNYAAGEARLAGRKDLKSLLSEIIKEGVEFVYSPTDVGWQWALDRANWNTISGGELSRRVKIRTTFTEGAVGVEMGAGGLKKRPAPKRPPIVEQKAATASEPEKVAAPAPAAAPEKKAAAATAKPAPSPKPVATSPAAKPATAPAKAAAPKKAAAPARAIAPPKKTAAKISLVNRAAAPAKKAAAPKKAALAKKKAPAPAKKTLAAKGKASAPKKKAAPVHKKPAAKKTPALKKAPAKKSAAKSKR